MDVVRIDTTEARADIGFKDSYRFGQEQAQSAVAQAQAGIARRRAEGDMLARIEMRSSVASVVAAALQTPFPYLTVAAVPTHRPAIQVVTVPTPGAPPIKGKLLDMII